MRQRIAPILLATLGLVAVALLSLALLTAAPGRAPRNLPVTVAFIGDSYIGGSAMGGQHEANITALLGRRFNWRVVNAAVGGTGYVAARPGAQPFQAGQLDRIVLESPALVVVAGSRNDSGRPGVTEAAATLYRALHDRLPGAKLVVVGPEWINGQPGPALLATRDAVRAAANAANATWIDPIQDGWFAGENANLIGADHVHPTDAGHAHMAQLLGDEIQAHGLIPTLR